ncbi:uncharacterized protein LOC112576042 isoform X2 [Pomacea canaliculata]|nr:uncharacterized protein LOC112576042 isoform X2 [Pomacea canaliculata]
MADTAPNSILKIVIISGLVISALKVSHDAVQDTFKNLDKDHDGILHEKEFFSFFDSIDTNGDDFLSHDEFTGAEEATLKEKTIAIFNFYDRLDGTVDQRVSRKLPHIMFSRLDHDGNGEIPYSEYQHSYPLFQKELVRELEHTFGHQFDEEH